MLIDINLQSENKINISGGEKISTNNPDVNFVLFRSPNHPPKQTNHVKDFGEDIKKYADYYCNDSFYLHSKKENKVYIGRDWPGNVTIFYWIDDPEKLTRCIISNDLTELIKIIPSTKISAQGVKLFFSDRHHYHSHTIYEGAELLHAGLYIELHLKKQSFNVKYWYKPYRTITIYKTNEAIKTYKEAIDRSLQRLLPRDKPIALMFSGGSDSTFLCERLISLGYDFQLFNMKVTGQDTAYPAAVNSAKYFNKKVIALEVDRQTALRDWPELMKMFYQELAEMRIDGMFSISKGVYQQLNEYYSGKPATIVWGMQYTIASPMVSTTNIILMYSLYYYSKIFKSSFLEKSNRTKDKIPHFLLRGAKILNKDFMASHQRDAFLHQYNDCLINSHNPDEFINLQILDNYNHLKHWIMFWRDIVGKKFYPNAINVHPFCDRTYQEELMQFSLAVRIDGWKNMLMMPKKYKDFFLRAFEASIPPSELLDHNLRNRPSYFTLWQNREFYDMMSGIFEKPINEPVVEYISRQCNIDVPTSYEKFKELETLKVEQLSGIMFLIIRFEADGQSPI